MSTISAHTNQKENFYTAKQEVSHKMIERAKVRLFGVFFKKYQFFYRPCRLEDMQDIMHACAILHSMDVIEKKANFIGARVTCIADEDDNVIGMNGHYTVHPPIDPPASIYFLAGVCGRHRRRLIALRAPRRVDGAHVGCGGGG